MNRYDTFLKVIEIGSFTKAAEELGYSQSAVSQMVQGLESELETTLISRSRSGISLTPDGKEFMPYIRNLSNSYRELMEKSREIHGLGSGNIRIGTFSSVSSNWLPGWIKEFKETYPSVHFDLQQGEYTSIAQYIKEGSVDFGFINPEAAEGLETVSLKEDHMLAVLPEEHPLAKKERITLEDLANEPFILLDEGDLSEPLENFKLHGLEPAIEYRVIDDYTIMAMVEKGLGISILSELVMNRVDYRIVKKEVDPPITRTIGLAYKNRATLPTASKHFIDFILKQFK